MTVEARGLAGILSLAADPPSKPTPPTATQQDSLTLYIVRVPGTKDVFLTPWKPRDRVVNAQDVQSSLYFVHVETEPDGLIPRRNHTSHEDQSEASISLLPSQSSGNSIRRRPLPTPPTSPDEFGCPSPRSPRELWSSMPTRKPVASSQEDPEHVPSSPPTHRQSWATMPTRKPISLPGSDRPVLPPRSARYSSSGVIARKPVLPIRSPVRNSMGSIQSISLESQDERASTAYDEVTGQKFTLIRRDPSSGEQWNVGKVHDPPVDEICSSPGIENQSSRRRKNSGAPLYIDIDNAGYLQFTSPQAQVFKRRMWMDGSRHADHTYSSQTHTTLSSNDRRSKGYAFLDAWGQKCEFSTSNTGRALKCRRDDHSSDAQSPRQGTKTDISELRFNLPTILSPRSDGPNSPSKRGLYTSTGTGATLESGTDYSLGRERAGGGFAGRETKLGKLIVHAAGFEMLDLVVAANIGLWWRAYERTSGR